MCPRTRLGRISVFFESCTEAGQPPLPNTLCLRIPSTPAYAPRTPYPTLTVEIRCSSSDPVLLSRPWIAWPGPGSKESKADWREAIQNGRTSKAEEVGKEEGGVTGARHTQAIGWQKSRAGVMGKDRQGAAACLRPASSRGGFDEELAVRVQRSEVVGVNGQSRAATVKATPPYYAHPVDEEVVYD